MHSQYLLVGSDVGFHLLIGFVDNKKHDLEYHQIYPLIFELLIKGQITISNKLLNFTLCKNTIYFCKLFIYTQYIYILYTEQNQY